MAQLIVLLEKDFKNTLRNPSTSKSIIFPHALTNTIKTGCKPFIKNITKGLNNDNVIEILPEDVINSGSDEDDGSCTFNKVNIKTHKNLRLKRTSEDMNSWDNGDKKLDIVQLREKNVSRKIEEENSEPDPFDDNSEDDSDFEVSDNKNKKKSQVAKKRKSVYNPQKKKKDMKTKQENHSDESEYVPEQDLDHDSDLDWEAEQSSSHKKIKKENGEIDDANKSIAKKFLDSTTHFICTVCKTIVKNAAEKENHRKSHNLRYLSFNTLYQCPDCAYQGSHSFGFRAHYQRIHSSESGLFTWKQCTECPYTTVSNNGLRAHLKHHNEKGTFQCKYCSFSHNHKKNITRHLRCHNKFLTGIFSCEECTYTTKHSSSIFKHKKIYHTPKDQIKWIRCNECPFKTMEVQNLKKHLKCHQLEDGYECPHCTYRSPYACRITDHIKIHFGKDEPIPDYDPKLQTPLHSCSKCSYKTMTKVHLDRHMTAHNTYTDRRIHCAECPFTCKDKIDLVTHVKCHNGDGALKCPWCSYTHWAKPTMTKHKRVHSEERENMEQKKNWRKGEPRCPICNELFHAYYLKRHMTKHQTIDQVDNPFMCAHCPYRSKSKDTSFINHIKCHFQTEGLKCEFCTFRHARINVMTIHTRLHKESSVKGEPE